MESNNEINKGLKEGYWYKNSKTDELIMIKEDMGCEVKVIKFIKNPTPTKDEDERIYTDLFLSEENIVNKEDIVPLEVTEENLFRFGFLLAPKWIYYGDLNYSGKTRVKYGSKFYLIYKTDKGIHEIQERYNLKLTPRRL